MEKEGSRVQEFKSSRVRKWALRNVVAAIVGLAVFTVVVNFNRSYHWLWFTFTKTNLADIKADRQLSLDDRMEHRLGVDYDFVQTVKGMTPENAVVFYPSRDDFLATPSHGKKMPFRGTIVDKIAAIRFLYPRRVVTTEELGLTPYAEKITHIAIVNGLHRDMVDYPCDTMPIIDVLPVNAEDYVPY